ncbi:hypothetical protein F6Y02_39385 (plasmid) [Bacillus megaterium]|nr:hypothetical protein [Priestia megaterium]
MIVSYKKDLTTKGGINLYVFNKDLVLASIKAVGEDHAIVQYQDKVEVNLSPEEAKEFHQYVVHQENMLVPMNIKTQKPFVDLEEHGMNKN